MANITENDKASLTPRNLKALENRNNIIEAAKRLVNERGYDNVTVNDIVEECGLTKGAFYYHFKSKSEAIFQLDRARFNRIAENLDGADTIDPLEKIAIYVRRWHAIMDADSLHFSQDWLRHNLNPDNRHKAYGNSSAFTLDYEIVRRFLQEAVDAKILKQDAPVDYIAKLILYFMYGSFCEKCLSDDPQPTVEVAEQFLDWMKSYGLAPFYTEEHKQKACS